MTVPSPADVHLWIVEFEGTSVTDLRGDLPIDESREADQLRLPSRRDEFIRQRAALRRLLGWYLDQQPSRVHITRGSNGKPALGGTKARLTFNVSHSGPHMLIGVTSERQIGVDVQVIKPGTKCVDLARRFFSTAEQKLLASVQPVQLERAFFDLWTLKEAWLKGTGAGISAGLDRFTIDAMTDPPRLASAEVHSAPPAWQFRRLTVAPDACAAIAVEGMAMFSLTVSRWRVADGAPAIA